MINHGFFMGTPVCATNPYMHPSTGTWYGNACNHLRPCLVRQPKQCLGHSKPMTTFGSANNGSRLPAAGVSILRLCLLHVITVAQALEVATTRVNRCHEHSGRHGKNIQMKTRQPASKAARISWITCWATSNFDISPRGKTNLHCCARHEQPDTD